MKRLPKGLGTVYKMTGARAKPYCTAITTSVPCESEKQKQTPIGYTKTREEGIRMLYLYHYEKLKLLPSVVISNPLLENKYLDHIMKMMEANVLSKTPTEVDNIDIINQLFLASLPTEEVAIDNSKISMLKREKEVPTFDEVYQNILSPIYSSKSNSLKYGMKAAHARLKKIHNRKINTLNIDDYQPIFDKVSETGVSNTILNRMKQICSEVSRWGQSRDYILKDYTQFIQYKSNDNVKRYKPFTIDEIKKVLNSKCFWSKIITVYIFTGMRPIEFIKMKKEDVHLEERYMLGGVKTASGKNRVIPIHNCIYEIIFELYEKAKVGKRLFCSENEIYTVYDTYRNNYKEIMKKLDLLDHEYPYETRHTFATIAEEFQLDTYRVKKILGHNTGDITKDVYTHPQIQALVDEVNKIKIC